MKPGSRREIKLIDSDNSAAAFRCGKCGMVVIPGDKLAAEPKWVAG